MFRWGIVEGAGRGAVSGRLGDREMGGRPLVGGAFVEFGIVERIGIVEISCVFDGFVEDVFVGGVECFVAFVAAGPAACAAPPARF